MKASYFFLSFFALFSGTFSLSPPLSSLLKMFDSSPAAAYRNGTCSNKGRRDGK